MAGKFSLLCSTATAVPGLVFKLEEELGDFKTGTIPLDEKSDVAPGDDRPGAVAFFASFTPPNKLTLTGAGGVLRVSVETAGTYAAKFEARAFPKEDMALDLVLPKVSPDVVIDLAVLVSELVITGLLFGADSTGVVMDTLLSVMPSLEVARRTGAATGNFAVSGLLVGWYVILLSADESMSVRLFSLIEGTAAASAIDSF